MQTTLLGLAIAFILALLAALIGPYFVDWSRFRPQFDGARSVHGPATLVRRQLYLSSEPRRKQARRDAMLAGYDHPDRIYSMTRPTGG